MQSIWQSCAGAWRVRVTNPHTAPHCIALQLTIGSDFIRPFTFTSLASVGGVLFHVET